MARRITWYWLNTGDLPIFIKARGNSAVVFHEDIDGGREEEWLASEPRVTVSTFYVEGSRDIIYQWIRDRAQALHSTNFPDAHLFGVIRHFELFVRNPENPIQVEVGLALAPQPFLPAFGNREGIPGVVRAVEPPECWDIGLPMEDVDSSL